MALYTDTVMDHFLNPRNVGEIPQADGVGEVGNAKCGDIMKMYLKIEDDVVSDVKFETFGCGSAIASSSMATLFVSIFPICWIADCPNNKGASILVTTTASTLFRTNTSPMQDPEKKYIALENILSEEKGKVLYKAA